MEGAAPPATREEPVVVNVDLGDRSYPIYIGAGLLNQPELLQNHVTGKKVQFAFPIPCNPLLLSLSLSLDVCEKGGNQYGALQIVVPKVICYDSVRKLS